MPRSSPRAKRVLRKRGSGSPRKKKKSPTTKKRSPRRYRATPRRFRGNKEKLNELVGTTILVGGREFEVTDFTEYSEDTVMFDLSDDGTPGLATANLHTRPYTMQDGKRSYA